MKVTVKNLPFDFTPFSEASTTETMFPDTTPVVLEIQTTIGEAKGILAQLDAQKQDKSQSEQVIVEKVLAAVRSQQ